MLVTFKQTNYILIFAEISVIKKTFIWVNSIFFLIYDNDYQVGIVEQEPTALRALWGTKSQCV